MIQRALVQVRSSRILLGLFLLWGSAGAFAQPELWLTDPDKPALFQRQNTALTFAAATPEHPTIEVDDTRT